MKLQYLASVQALLDNYEFQDKYKVMLDLEQTLTSMEQNGTLDQSTVLTTLGTPAQFVEEIISKYNLTLTANGQSSTNRNIESPSYSNQQTTSTNSNNNDYSNYNDSNNGYNNNQNHGYNNNNQNHAYNNNQNHGYNNNNGNNHNQNSGYNQVNSQQNNHSNNGYNDSNYNSSEEYHDGIAAQAAKAPVKIAFTVINVIFFIIAFLVFATTIVATMVLLVLIDVQTALTLVLGVVFLLICIYLLIRFFRTLIYSIIENRYNAVKLIMMVIFIILFGFLANIMLSSAIDAVNLYVTNNMNSVYAALTERSIDLTNIDLQNMDLSQYIDLIGEAVKAYFIPA